MNISYWTGFSKRKNSTKQPTSGTTATVYLKDDTSILNPTFDCTGVPDNVNYIYVSDFGRYYFVSDVTHVGKDRILINCTVDVLATYKSQIGGYSGFIEYTSSSSDVTITDPRNMPTYLIDTSYNTLSITSNPFNSTGCYIVAVLSGGSGGSGLGTYYALTPIEFLSFNGDVYDSTVIGQLIDQFTQVRDSFVSCIWLPVNISSITGIANTSIQIGRVTLPTAKGKMITGRKINTTTGASTLTFPSGSGAGNALEYIDLPPYTTGFIYLPFVGCVPMDMNPAAMYKSLAVDIHIDVMTGDIIYKITYGGGGSTTYTGNIATKMPISSSSYDAVGTATGVLTTIGGIIGTIASSGSGAVAALGSAATALHGLNAATKSMELHTMINGSASSAIGAELGLSPVWAIYQYIPTMTNLTDLQAEQGMPYYKVNTISNLSGFVKCSRASVSINGFDSERDTVNDYMDGGFYYE